jgi:hypothetical protein
MCTPSAPLTKLSIAGLWPRSRGRSSARVNDMRPLGSSMRRPTKMRFLDGRRTSTGSSKSSTCVESTPVWRLLRVSLSDGVVNQQQCDALGYPSKCVGEPGRRRWTKPIGECDFLWTDNEALTVSQAQVRSVVTSIRASGTYTCTGSLWVNYLLRHLGSVSVATNLSRRSSVSLKTSSPSLLWNRENIHRARGPPP